MALVKTTALGRHKTAGAVIPRTANGPTPLTASLTVRKRERSMATREQVAERVAAISVQFASGVASAATAAEELQRTLQQIASGAEEAAGAAHESLSTVSELARRFADARTEVEVSRRQVGVLRAVVVESTTMIAASLLAIDTNAGRQLATVDSVRRLEDVADRLGPGPIK